MPSRCFPTGERLQRGSPVDGDELLGRAVLSRRGQLPVEDRSEWRARHHHHHHHHPLCLHVTDLEPCFITICVCVCVCSFKKSAPRRKCAACRIVVHTGCMEQLEQVRHLQSHQNQNWTSTCAKPTVPVPDTGTLISQDHSIVS